MKTRPTPEEARAYLAQLQNQGQAQPSRFRKYAQEAAGIPSGILSAADIPALGYNAVTYGVNKLAEQFSDNPAHRADYLPYYGQQAGRALGNAIAGEPQTKEEEEYRQAGEIAGGFINPVKATQVALSPIKGAINKATKVNPKAVESFREAGITPTLADVSESRVLKRGQNILSEAPGSAGVLEKAGIKRESELENAFNEIRDKSLIKTRKAGGELLKEGGKLYNKKATTIASKLYDKAFKGANEQLPIKLTDTITDIDNTLRSLTPEGRKAIESSSAGRELMDLRSAIANNGGNLPLHDAKNIFKTRLNNLITTHGQVGKADQGMLKNVVKSLDRDIQASVVSANPKAARDFKKADKFWQQYSERNRKIANKTAKKETGIGTFNDTMNALKKGDAEPYKILTQRLSAKEQETLTSTFIDKMGLKKNEFDPKQFATNFKKMPPESRNILFNNLDAGNRKKLDSIVEAIDHTKGTSLAGNPSGTAYTALLMGLIASPKTAAGTISGAYGIGHAFTSPRLVNALYTMNKAKTPEQATKIFDRYKSIFAKAGISQLPNPNEAQETQGKKPTPEEARRFLKQHQLGQ